MEKKKYRQSFTFEGHRYNVRANSEKELIEKIAIKKKELEEGTVRITRQMRVDSWVVEFLAVYKEPHVTYKEYMNINNQYNNWIKPYIGKRRLCDVKRIECIKILNVMGEKRLSRGYIKKIRTLLHSIFDTELDSDLIIKNPAGKLPIPKNAVDGQRRAASKQEQEVFEEVCKTHEYGDWLMLILYFGCRPNETARIQGRLIAYPGDNGTNMMQALGGIHLQSTNKIWHDADTVPGQSGSPISFEWSRGTVIGVHTQGLPNPNALFSSGIKITPQMYNVMWEYRFGE